ncbi:MAG: glycosyltransferase [Candidatus Aminicenantes bacterium]|nr:glycosyltransferase [Candidatus Aminicenantes bacterium]
MRETLISFYETYPPESGAANVSYNLAKYLPGEKHLIQISHHKETDKMPQESAGGVKLINIQIASKNRVLKFFKIFLSFFTIVKKIRTLKPDAVILEGASWTFYYFILAKLMNWQNLDMVTIYHSHNVEYLLRRERNSWPVVQMTRFSEKWLMNHSDLSTAVSQKDANLFKRLYGAEPVLLPNGVDIKSFNEVKHEQIKDIKKKYRIEGKVILFMGLAGYKPTEEALNFLVYKVFPKVLSEQKKAKLAVLGGKIPFQKEFIINPGVISYREVPVFIKACNVCVAPIFSGSGTRLKILEYMAAGKPVVSTLKGAEGLDVKPGRDIIIADSGEEFAEAVLNLLAHPDKANSVGLKGRELVHSKYSWEKIVNDFANNLEALFFSINAEY